MMNLGLSALNPVAALSTALSLGESALAYKGQKDANESNELIARENRQFQAQMVNQAQEFEERMSGSAYQRAMEDMKKAGLNPMLAYQQGGASTPIGKTAGGSVATMQSVFGGMKGSPSEIASTAAGLGKTLAETDKIHEDIKMVGKQMRLTDKQVEKVEAEVRTLDEKLKGIQDENVAKDIIAKHFKQYPSSALAEHFGGKSVATLGSVLASTGITKYLKFLKETIDRVRSEWSFDFSPSWNTTNNPGINPLIDRY